MRVTEEMTFSKVCRNEQYFACRGCRKIGHHITLGLARGLAWLEQTNGDCWEPELWMG